MAKKKKKPEKPSRKTRASEKPDLFDTLPNLWQHLTCLVALLLLSLVFFHSFHFGGKTVVASDNVQWQAAAESALQFERESGQPALWVTNMFAGMPAYMIRYPARVFQVDTIVIWLRTVAWPSSHFVFLLAGMYLLAFRLTKDRLASVIAAVGYGLTTYVPILLVAGHNSKFVTLCFAPWLLLAFSYVLKQPGILSSLLFAAATAVILRAGHIQIAYYFTFVLLVWWIAEGVSAIRNGTLPAFARVTAFLAMGGVLGMMMVVQPFWATAEYKAYSIRGAAQGGDPGGLAWDYAMTWSQGPGELLTLLIADAFGGGSHYWGPKPLTSGPHYVGGVVLLFALIGAFKDRRPATIGIAIAALTMTLFALGRHLPVLNRPMFDHFPLFNAFRAPETWLAAVSCTLALLSAIGISRVGKLVREGPDSWRRVIGVAVGLGVLVVILFLGKGALFAFEKPSEFDRIARQLAQSEEVAPTDPRVQQATRQYLDGFRTERVEKFDRDAFRTLAVLAVCVVLILLLRSGKVSGSVWKIALVLLMTTDLFGVARRYVNEDIMIDRRQADQQVPRYDFDDFIVDRVEEAGGAGRFRVLSLEGNPTFIARPSHWYESVGGYHGAKLRNFQDFMDQVLFADGLTRPNRAALTLLGVRYVVAPGSVSGLTPVFQGDRTGLAVLENPDVSERSFLVGEVVRVAANSDAWEIMRSPDFDPFVAALVTEAVEMSPASIDSNSTASVVLESFSPREIRWRIDTDAQRMLVASEIYYPAGWFAEIDGVEARIVEVDAALRGVVVPAGNHEVVMRFDPRSDRLGVVIAGTSTAIVYLGILALLLLGWKRRTESSIDVD